MLIYIYYFSVSVLQALNSSVSSSDAVLEHVMASCMAKFRHELPAADLMARSQQQFRANLHHLPPHLSPIPTRMSHTPFPPPTPESESFEVTHGHNAEAPLPTIPALTAAAAAASSAAAASGVAGAGGAATVGTPQPPPPGLMVLSEMCKTQMGSRSIQNQLLEGDPTFVDFVLRETFETLSDLMYNLFGNYLVQSLITLCTPPQRMRIVAHIAPSLMPLACDKQGTRAVQKLVECASTPVERAVILDALLGGTAAMDVAASEMMLAKCIYTQGAMRFLRHADRPLLPPRGGVPVLGTPSLCLGSMEHSPAALRLMHDVNGWHVINVALEFFPLRILITSGIIDTLYSVTRALSSDQHGVVLLKKALTVTPSFMYVAFAQSIIIDAPTLANNQFGNYLIQHLVERAAGLNEVSNALNARLKDDIAAAEANAAAGIDEDADDDAAAAGAALPSLTTPSAVPPMTAASVAVSPALNKRPVPATAASAHLPRSTGNIDVDTANLQVAATLEALASLPAADRDRYYQINTALAQAFRGCVHTLSCQKFASKVIERCLRVGAPELRNPIVAELVADPQAFMTLVQDPSGGFVIQNVLKVADLDHAMHAATILLQHIPALPRTSRKRWEKHIEMVRVRLSLAQVASKNAAAAGGAGAAAAGNIPGADAIASLDAAAAAAGFDASSPQSTSSSDSSAGAGHSGHGHGHGHGGHSHGHGHSGHGHGGHGRYQGGNSNSGSGQQQQLSLASYGHGPSSLMLAQQQQQQQQHHGGGGHSGHHGHSHHGGGSHSHHNHHGPRHNMNGGGGMMHNSGGSYGNRSGLDAHMSSLSLSAQPASAASSSASAGSAAGAAAPPTAAAAVRAATSGGRSNGAAGAHSGQNRAGGAAGSHSHRGGSAGGSGGRGGRGGAPATGAAAGGNNNGNSAASTLAPYPTSARQN